MPTNHKNASGHHVPVVATVAPKPRPGPGPPPTPALIPRAPEYQTIFAERLTEVDIAQGPKDQLAATKVAMHEAHSELRMVLRCREAGHYDPR
eukprot:6542406-Pyramimonas_sp.AAC.1